MSVEIKRKPAKPVTDPIEEIVVIDPYGDAMVIYSGPPPLNRLVIEKPDHNIIVEPQDLARLIQALAEMHTQLTGEKICLP